MKGRTIKFLAAFLVSLTCLTNISFASEYSNLYPGWYKNVQLDANRTSYVYILSDGTYATGWQYIDGGWYYFDTNYDDYVGYDWVNPSNGRWCFIDDSAKEIDGNMYVFDHNGALVTNADFQLGRLQLYHADENGHLTELN